MIKKLITHFNNDHLYRNSLYLMASTVVLAGFGFFFWIIAARGFTTAEVGIATTLISVSTLISSFCILGLNISLNRFLPKSEKRSEMISSSFILVSLAAVLATVIFLIGVNLFSPKLSFLTSNFLYVLTFIFFIVILSLNSLIDSVFIAYRASGNVLFKNTILSALKIGFIFLFVSFGAYGIFSSFATSMAISFFVSLVILIYKFNFRPVFFIDTTLVRKLGKFSIGNYVSSLLASTPLLILPVIIVNTIGASAAAYYYIDTMILGLLLTIPSSVSQSLLTEGSHDESLLKQHIIKALKITYLLLIPSVFIAFFFGDYVLQFFGQDYADDAFRFLQIISISALFMPISMFISAIMKIHQEIRDLVIFNLIGCVLILSSCYVLASFGLVGIGWGILIGQIIISLIYLLYAFINK
jgi:O-antigen/teichoic acid export membrane protein